MWTTTRALPGAWASRPSPLCSCSRAGRWPASWSGRPPSRNSRSCSTARSDFYSPPSPLFPLPLLRDGRGDLVGGSLISGGLLVTGGTGVLGRALLARLQSDPEWKDRRLLAWGSRDLDLAGPSSAAAEKV